MQKLRPAGNTARCDPQLDKDGLARPARDFRCWCMPLTVSCDSPAGYDAYVSHGDIAYLKYEDDWAFGFPGKLARCAVPVFESDALAMRTFIASHETNYRLAKTGPVLTVFPKRWGIYRTDYSPQGPDKLCRLLRDKFDGPPCPATAELGAKMACLRHARAANASTVKEARKATPSWFWERAACDNATEFIDRRLRGGFVHGHRRRPHHHSPP